ncbi:T6SS effector phospholipase Tle3 domain-containing protein, partial [Caballeronia glebae]|uniref:T6SS effector phospholipase Tle3 domain-containing protein n=1 Tax=Caballeronia glebae TaxID=1777143 RepID=UPI000AEA7D04
MGDKTTQLDTFDAQDGAGTDDAESKHYKLGVATNVVPMQISHLGEPYWESYQTPSGYQVYAQALVPPHLPGIVIFVHGVNSEGEWYEAAEGALCEGLNRRLGRQDITPNAYSDKGDKGGMTARHVQRVGRSPVIRFYWGYRPEDGKEHKWPVPLRNIRGEDGWKTKDLKDSGPWYWGGGPFQNGTNNLQQLWSRKGFDPTMFGFVNIQWFNTEWDRELHAAPGRQYYAHAAQRLANLIDKIRMQCPGDTITVMSHSQGTMVSMAATLMCKTRAPDALFVMNSPFALEDKSTDALTTGHNRPTTQARVNTFRNVAERIKKDRKVFTEEDLQLLHVGATKEMELWNMEAVNNDIQERDNHGRFYVYFNPHDRVMGSAALASIGWQGVSDALIDELGDTVKQRMLARGTPCGEAPAMTKFGSLPPILNPEPGVKPDDFWNGNRTVAGLDLWVVPNKNQRVNINAEQVPDPITAEEMALPSPYTVTLLTDGQPVQYEVYRYFDQALSDQNALGARSADGSYLDRSVPFLESIHKLEKQVRSDPYTTGPTMRTENHDEMIKRYEEYQPMPTNHSTLPQHHEFMS